MSLVMDVEPSPLEALDTNAYNAMTLTFAPIVS